MEHLNEVESLLNHLHGMNVKYDDGIQVLLILASLLNSRKTLIVSLQNTSHNGKITKATVTSVIPNKEMMRNSSFETSLIDVSNVSKGEEIRGVHKKV